MDKVFRIFDEVEKEMFGDILHSKKEELGYVSITYHKANKIVVHLRKLNLKFFIVIISDSDARHPTN